MVLTSTNLNVSLFDFRVRGKTDGASTNLDVHVRIRDHFNGYYLEVAHIFIH